EVSEALRRARGRPASAKRRNCEECHFSLARSGRIAFVVVTNRRPWKRGEEFQALPRKWRRERHRTLGIRQYDGPCPVGQGWQHRGLRHYRRARFEQHASEQLPKPTS